MCVRTRRSVVKDDAQKRIVYVQPAIVFDEPEFAELVHKETDSTSCSANHFAKVACETFATIFCGFPLFPYLAINSNARARHFSLELKS